MYQNKGTSEFYHMAHLVLLIGYTGFVGMFFVITFLLEWEKWPLILAAVAVITCWFIFIRSIFEEKQRTWVICIVMMCNFFIYGTHLTSTYDLVIVMSVIAFLLAMTGRPGTVTACQITYYITMTYDLICLSAQGNKLTMLLACRIAMHYIVMTIIASLARSMIKRWQFVLDESSHEIEELVDSSQRLNDFLANVSHELRTPVNAVIGLSNICLDKEESPELRSNMLEVRNAGRRMAEQIGDILDYSEMDSGNIVINPEDYMIGSLLNDLMVDLREIKPEKLELIIDVDPGVPAVLNTDVVKMKKIIKSLISNGFKYTQEGGVYLRITSEKKTYGVNLIIEVSDTGIGMNEEELEKVYERFYQSDSGRSRKSGGLGLGLGIVSGFVSLLGGFITINSKAGVGTTVRVSLPQTVIDESRCISLKNPKEVSVAAFLDINKYLPGVREFYTAQAKTMLFRLGLELHTIESQKALKNLSENLTHLFIGQEEYLENKEYVEKLAKELYVVVVTEPGYRLPENTLLSSVEKPFYAFPIASILNSSKGKKRDIGSQMKLKNIKALVVDDEPMNLVVAKSIFKRYDMAVTTAMSGQESIDLCRKQTFDIIFMDHMMAGMDGVEAMKKIRSDVSGLNSLVPVIALTANAMSSAKQMFMAEGFDGFVSKPIELESLERAIKKVLPKEVIYYVNPEDEKEAKKAGAKKSASDEAIEFGPSDGDALEFGSAGSDKSGASGGEPMEFSPDDSDVMEFGPDGDDDVMEFGAEDDDVMEFGPSDESGSDSGADDFATQKKQMEGLGINVGAGVEYCMGDADFYIELLQQFVSEADEKVGKLRSFYDEKDFKNYEILIHAVKSNSKMIGIDDLSEDAKQLEKAAREGDIDYVDSNHSRVVADYESIAGELKRILN